MQSLRNLHRAKEHCRQEALDRKNSWRKSVIEKMRRKGFTVSEDVDYLVERDLVGRLAERDFLEDYEDESRYAY